MKAFEDLTSRGQIKRLRRLAQAARPQYGLGELRPVFVEYSENAVFRVESPHGRFALRVHRPSHQTEASLDSELAWMAALRHDAGLPVPEPRPSLQGKLRVQASAPGISGPRNVSLLKWLPGRKPAHRIRPTHFEALGQLIARMHELAMHWQPPEGFTRRHWDWEGLFGDQAGLDRGETCPIDFDDCGYGYWLYDLATPLAHWQTHPQWPVYRQALLDGFAGIRSLPEEQLAHLDLFMAARHVSEMLWGIDQAQSKPSFRQELDEWLEWAALHVNLYLENKEAL